jgi:hypothetical protein
VRTLGLATAIAAVIVLPIALLLRIIDGRLEPETRACAAGEKKPLARVQMLFTS